MAGSCFKKLLRPVVCKTSFYLFSNECWRQYAAVIKDSMSHLSSLCVSQLFFAKLWHLFALLQTRGFQKLNKLNL